MSKRLSKRERQFVAEYLVDMVGSDAMRRCGYTGKRPDDAAYKMLQRSHVKEAIDQGAEEGNLRAGVRREKVIRTLASIAYDESHKGADRVRALELMGKYLALFTDKHEVTGKDGGPLPGAAVYLISKDEATEIGKDLDDKV